MSNRIAAGDSCGIDLKESLSDPRQGTLFGGPKVRAIECKLLIFGGAKRDRTADLLVANEALSQLSYSPTRWEQPASV
jgi:hypothetical protein